MSVEAGGYRREIDGLRAIAVLPVVVYHAVAQPGGGFVGVDVFFVISGYLITSILMREWDRTGRLDLAAFYARRIRRLWPALIAMLAVVSIAAAVVLAPLGRWYAYADSAVASAGFVANVYFEFRTGGYFDVASDEQPLLHLWSLAVEEQFYLVYPLILMLLLRLPRRRGRALLLALSLLSFWLAEAWMREAPEKAFFQMAPRFWELALGGIVAFGTRGARSELAAAASASVGLLAIVASMFFLGDGSRFPAAGALPAVLGAALVLFAVHGSARLGLAGRLLGSGPMVFVGVISYPLYLWHWPLLALDAVSRLEPASAGWRLGLCAVSGLLAWLTWRVVETPLRRGVVPTGRVFRVGLSASAVVVLLVLGVSRFEPGAVEAERVARASNDRPPDMDRCHLSSSPARVALPVADCGSRGAAPPTVVIWGDSHALAWKPFAWALASEAGGVATAYTMDACPPVADYRGSLPGSPHFSEDCSRFNALAQAAIEQGDIDTLVVVARWPRHLRGDLQSRSERDRAARRAVEGAEPRDIEAGLRSMLAAVAPHVRRVILLAPTPVLNFDAPQCIGTRRTGECALERAAFDAKATPARRMLADLAAAHANVEVVDPAGYFCGPTVCPVLKDGESLFWDDDHVSGTAARGFAAAYLAGPEGYTGQPPTSHRTDAVNPSEAP